MENKKFAIVDITQTEGYKKSFNQKIESEMNKIGEEFAEKNIERQKKELIESDKLRNSQRKLDFAIAQLGNKKRKAKEEDAYEKEMKRLKMRENLPHIATLLLIISILSSGLSATMSVASVSHYYDISQLSGVFDSIYFLPAFIMFLAQVVAVVLSIVSHAIKQYYRRTSPIVTCVRLFICVISVFTNHGFLCSVIAEYTASRTGVILGWVFAAVPDLFSFWLSNCSTKLKYRLYENDDDEQSENDNIGIITKIIENKIFAFREKVNDEWAENQLIRKQKEAERRYRYAQLDGKPLETQRNFKVSSKKQKKTLENNVVLNTDRINVSRKTKEEICEPYRTKILSIPAGSEVSHITLNLDKKRWRIIRDYFCKDGLLVCEGKGKPTRRTGVA